MKRYGNGMTEDAAISALHRLQKKWPKSLWLFAASGTLTVMKKDENGNKRITEFGGFDSDATVTTIDIECDGGDW